MFKISLTSKGDKMYQKNGSRIAAGLFNIRSDLFTSFHTDDKITASEKRLILGRRGFKFRDLAGGRHLLRLNALVLYEVHLETWSVVIKIQRNYWKPFLLFAVNYVLLNFRQWLLFVDRLKHRQRSKVEAVKRMVFVLGTNWFVNDL